jgi:ferredoxin-nitrite reductase
MMFSHKSQILHRRSNLSLDTQSIKPRTRSHSIKISSNAVYSDQVLEKLSQLGVSPDISGLKHLSDDARLKAIDKKANKFEKIKVEKCGSHMWTEVEELATLIREGKSTWEDLNLDDVDVRLKWAGLFHRRKRTPGRFMMRLKVPQGELTSEQLRFLGKSIAPYGKDGCADITTRANIQLRGITLEDADIIIAGLKSVGLSSVMSGMDNVRNITGSPIAGIDPHEMIDTRPLCHEINDMITSSGLGNPELTNLPRKINIGLSGSRDDYAHCHINDVGLRAVVHPGTGEVGFNVELGGYFSIKRNIMSVSGDTFLTQEQVVPYCKALLEVFRDNGRRDDRQKARLVWLVEEWGIDAFREAIAERMGLVVGSTTDQLQREVHVSYDQPWERRDVLGIHKQKQDGYSWVGACVPVGRMAAQDFYDIADIAERYGDGTVRLTVEENIVFPNILSEKLPQLTNEPLFHPNKFAIGGGPLSRGLVSCTGAQFCGIALIETKQRALQIIEKLEAELDIPGTVRIHWTGCPNSCGQAQVADIGLMGAPAKLNGKAVEGVKIFLGGKIGEDPELGKEFEKGIPCDESVLIPKLKEILIEKFGAKVKNEEVAGSGAFVGV